MGTAVPNNCNLECSICFESFKTPKILSCGHTFCLECLVIYIDGRKGTFPCPFCKQHVQIPQGGVNNFITNVLLQSSPNSPRTTNIPSTQPSTTLKPKHDCPNHSKKEVEYYCQTCSLGLCSKCIYIDHKDHKALDLELVSTRETVVEELSKSQQFIKTKIEDLEKMYAALLETSEKLKSFCDEACTKISEKTEKIIGELKQNCEEIQKEIQNNFDKNESKLRETQQKVRTQIKNMETDLDTFRPSTKEPSLTLVYSLTKLKHLQKLCENMKTDIPPVTYVEWKEGSVDVCDILGSTVTKPLNQSSEGNGPISTEPLQFIWGSGPNPLYPSSKGNVFKLTMSGNSEDRYTHCGLVWSCGISTSTDDNNCYIIIGLLEEDNPLIRYCEIKHTLTLLNIDSDKNVVRETEHGDRMCFRPDTPISSYNTGLQIPEARLTDPTEGFIDSKGQFLVRCVLLQVGNVQNR